MIKFKNLKKVRRTLFIDPGFNTGLIIWGVNNFKHHTLKNNDTKETLLFRVHNLIDQLDEFVAFNAVSFVVLEYQSYWQGSVRSDISAKTGKLLDLTLLTGHYCQYFHSIGIPIELVQPNQWKGQLNDNTVKARIKKITGIDNLPNSHVRDAFGMSLYKMGVFSNDKK